MRSMVALILALLAAPVAAGNSFVQNSISPWSGQAAPRGEGSLRPTMLRAHNLARSEYGSAPLAWSEALAADAAQWAQTLASRDDFDHDPALERTRQGENLFKGTRSAFSYAAMAKLWTDEKRDFRKGVFPDVVSTGHWSRVGHYTQIVWPASREVGCAVASNAREDFLVCRYWPSGNYFGVELL